MLYLAGDRETVEVGQMYAGRSNDSQIAITKKEQIARVIQNCRNIAGDKVLVISEPNDCRRTIAARDDLVRFVGQKESCAISKKSSN